MALIRNFYREPLSFEDVLLSRCLSSVKIVPIERIELSFQLYESCVITIILYRMVARPRFELETQLTASPGYEPGMFVHLHYLAMLEQKCGIEPLS